MSKVIKKSSSEEGVRVECPCKESCEFAIPETEWNFKYITDHFCKNGHLFRIEGKNSDELVMYEIDSRLTSKKNLV